jgi:hypothetical protein
MSTQTPTHAERLVEIRERLEALTGVSAFSAVGNCYREDIPYLLERLTFAEDAVRTCADEQECPDCWAVFYQGVAFGADRRTKAELRTEIDRLTALVAVMRPLAEGDPCWTVDSVCGYCEGRAGDGATYHKPDCEWLKAHAALAKSNERL